VVASPYRLDAAAGQARLALMQGNLAGALRAIEPLLVSSAVTGTGDNPFEGAEFPRLVEWTCHRVMASARGRSDPEAAAWLARAHEALQVRAATIADAALRDGFLNNIPVHREIERDWAER
jgi:hypothetical protein